MTVRHHAFFTERSWRFFPSITTVVTTSRRKNPQVAVGTERCTTVPAASPRRLGSRSPGSRANSFFQTNTAQASGLYENRPLMAKLRPDDVVFDLYSGTGTIALHVADEVRHVVGIGRCLCRGRCETNAPFPMECRLHVLLGDLKDTLLGSALARNSSFPSGRHSVDPPRVGMHEKVVREISPLAPRCIVYGQLQSHRPRRAI